MYDAYINLIKTQLQLQPQEWSFKSNKDYCQILEHVSYQQGLSYFNIIKSKHPIFYRKKKDILINLCHENDIYGKTRKYLFDNFTECSPTNFRYILHSIIILKFIKKKKLQNINFIEIGGGYGGLCFFIHRLSYLFNIKINNYVIFDLLEVSKLQEKYLNCLKVNNITCCQIDNFSDLHKNSFLISNYAFSEISKNLQVEYINKVIESHVTHGFLTWNFIPFYLFIKNSIIEKEDEYPLTGNGNYYVKFYPKN